MTTISQQLGTLPPLKLTRARWVNRRRPAKALDGTPSEKWAKVLAHTGTYEQFRYGEDHPSDWNGPLQVCIVGCPGTGVFFIDVDHLDGYLTTRTAQHIRREHAISTRGERFHVLVDARSVPADRWPKQGPIPGGDIKSNGFIPMPGSTHWTGEKYEPVLSADGLATVVAATPELLAAIEADQADAASTRPHGSSGSGGNGGGHDGEVAAQVLGWVRQALNAGLDPADPAVKEQIHGLWLKIAVPRDPAWPFTREDFERHYATAVAKARATPEFGAVQVTPDAAAWLQSTAVRPVTCAEAEAVYAKWLHDPDPVPTRIVLAAYAANMFLSGDPVWIMLVGGSGIGKTERIMPVSSMPHVVMVSTLTGEAALLSASPKRERAVNATGGVLRQVGEHGIVVVKDFTSVLSMSRDRRAEVVAALREVFDGRWDRHYGTDGGQVLTWQGHCGFIAGCTTAIDSAHTVLDAMGTRFLFVRLPDADLNKIGSSALAHAGHEKQMRNELADVTRGLLSRPGQPHEIHDGVRSWLLPLANLASQARSPVQRDYQGEIELVLDAEAPTRIIKQLGQLWKACGLLGLDEASSWAAVRRAGLDSIPKLRRAVVTHLGACAGNWQPTTDVAQAVAHPPRTTRRALEDLTAHGIVVRNTQELGARMYYSWALSGQALTWWRALNPGL